MGSQGKQKKPLKSTTTRALDHHHAGSGAGDGPRLCARRSRKPGRGVATGRQGPVAGEEPSWLGDASLGVYRPVGVGEPRGELRGELARWLMWLGLEERGGSGLKMCVVRGLCDESEDAVDCGEEPRGEDPREARSTARCHVCTPARAVPRRDGHLSLQHDMGALVGGSTRAWRTRHVFPLSPRRPWEVVRCSVS